MTFVFEALITTIGSIAAIMLLNHNWFKRKEMEYQYSIKKYRMGHKYKLKQQELPETPQPGLMDQLRNMDPKKLLQLANSLTGESEEYDEEPSDPIERLLSDPNVQKLITQYVNRGDQNPQNQMSQVR